VPGQRHKNAVWREAETELQSVERVLDVGKHLRIECNRFPKLADPAGRFNVAANAAASKFARRSTNCEPPGRRRPQARRQQRRAKRRRKKGRAFHRAPHGENRRSRVSR